MKIVFIDCEIANKHNLQPKICQFGYVVADDAAGILERGNFYINPGREEDFSNIEERGIKIDHPEDNYAFYRSQNLFPSFYPRILSLLTSRDVIIAGWGVDNDLFYLKSECQRYDLKIPALKAFDIQLLYMSHNHILHSTSLHTAIEQLFKDDEEVKAIVEHNSESDSYLTYRVLKSLCYQADYSWSACFETQEFIQRDMDESFAKHREILKLKEQKAHFIRSIPWDRIKRFSFFDTECANTFNNEGKICEFGQVTCDTLFQSHTAGRFIINPRDKFHLVNRKNKRDLHLEFEENNYEKYYSSHEFDYFLDDITYFFIEKDVLFFGFDVKNDLHSLDYSFKRYGGVFPNVYVIDVRDLYKRILNDKRSLEAICEEYATSQELSDLRFHNSQDDSFATEIALKYLLINTHSTLKEILNTAGLDCVKNLNIDAMLYDYRKQDESLINEHPRALMSSGKGAYHFFLQNLLRDKKYQTSLHSKKYNGKRILIAGKVQDSKIDCVKLMKDLIQRGFIFPKSTNEADIGICLDEENVTDLREKIKHDIKLIPISDLKDLDNCEDIEISMLKKQG